MGFNEYSVEQYEALGVQDLQKLRRFTNVRIYAARQCLDEGDLRAPKALAFYRGERQKMNQALYRLRYGDEGPPDQSVQLKPAMMEGEGKSNAGADAFEVFVRELFEAIGGGVDG